MEHWSTNDLVPLYNQFCTGQLTRWTDELRTLIGAARISVCADEEYDKNNHKDIRSIPITLLFQ
jgi:hypothetical protein